MKKSIAVLLTCFLIFTKIYAADADSQQQEFLSSENYEYHPEFSQFKIDLKKEKILPLEHIIGKTYIRKDKENKLKLTYVFNKDQTFTFKTDFGIMKMMVSGEYKLTASEIILYPKEHEARIFGIKAENMEVKDSAYEPETFDCHVISKGILLGGDFYKQK
ncbi:MAG: hypothetical protein MJ185_00210 [Treponema sp.]|nr:hypothetical protein [Treponema sp.]